MPCVCGIIKVPTGIKQLYLYNELNTKHTLESYKPPQYVYVGTNSV